MKKNLIGILGLSAIILVSQSCKKELSADVMATVPAEEAIVIYNAPDTASASTVCPGGGGGGANAADVVVEPLTSSSVRCSVCNSTYFT